MTTQPETLKAGTAGTRPRVGVIALGRSTFDIPFAEETLKEAWASLKLLDIDIIGTPTLALTPEDVAVALPVLQAQQLDLLLVLQVTFTDAAVTVDLAKSVKAPLAMWSFGEERTGGRLRLNSFCGVNLASHSLSRHGIQIDVLHGSPDNPKVHQDLLVLATAGAVANRLRSSRLLLIGEHPDGFDACDFDDDVLAERFGVSVERTPVKTFIDEVKQLPDSVADAPYARRQIDFDNLADLDPEPTRRTLKVYSALRDKADSENFAGIAVRCWPEFFTDYGCAACGALALLNEDKTPGGCEADVMGVVTSLALQEASGGTVFNTDLVDIDIESDTVVFWHCGQAPIDMADRTQPVRGTIHSNRQLPLLSEFALKPGRITIARFSQGLGKLRLVLAGGDMVQAPLPFSGTSGTARLDVSTTDFLERMVSEGVEHHTTLTYGEHRPVMRALARRLGIEVVELT